MSIGEQQKARIAGHVCAVVLVLVPSFTLLPTVGRAAGAQVLEATPLVADVDHEVVVVPDCDAAIRYPKRSSPYYGIPIRLYVNTSKEQYYFHAHPRRSLQVYEDLSAIRMKDYGGPAKVGMECFDPRAAAGTGRTWLSPRLIGRSIVAQRQIDRASFCQSVEVQAAACGQIQAYSQFTLTDPLAGPHSVDVLVWVWRTRDLVYIFASKNNPQHLAVQVQINSLAPSVPSVNLDDPQFRLYFQ